uniref:Uncharacterized protein n=1 Tax=Brassica oleracea var. oleracea TaxID=109376 RepID=A0A0D3EGT0_BRAOL
MIHRGAGSISDYPGTTTMTLTNDQRRSNITFNPTIRRLRPNMSPMIQINRRVSQTFHTCL